MLFVLLFPVSAIAQVNVDINISMPPFIVFAAPPELIVIPETYVYAVPDSNVDIYFYNGWWWRPWDGRWYYSRHYNSGWIYYQRVPAFYREIPPGWRNDYRHHHWKGHPWNYKRIPHQQVQQNWSSWEKSRHWEKQNTWGVKGLKPEKQSKQPSQAVPPKHKANQQYYQSSKPQKSSEVKQQQSKQQNQGKPQKSQSEPGKNEKGQGNKHDKK
jgi:hypothetical protein